VGREGGGIADTLPCWGASNQILGPSLMQHASIQQEARDVHSSNCTCTLLTWPAITCSVMHILQRTAILQHSMA
jgi:hypothetical protein